jgi:hypothetical protein
VTKKQKLTPKLYDPSPGTNEVSMMRVEFMGGNECKRRAKLSEKADKTFTGFCAISVKSVRSLTHQAHDSRSEYPGHAHISLSGPVPGLNGAEPLSPEDLKIFRDHKKQLEEKSEYFEDPQPNSRTWSGGQLF